MATSRHDEIDMDSGSESAFEIDIDEVVSSDLDRDESDDESTPLESFITRNWIQSDFHSYVFHFDERNSGISPKMNVSNCDIPLDCFELLFDEKLIILLKKRITIGSNVLVV